MNKKENNSIDLRQQLTWRNSMQFPLQSKASRREILIGGLWLLLPIIGWLINMGHRVRVVHRLQKGETPWPAWENPTELFKHGLITFLGMIWYGWPGVSLLLLGYWYSSALMAYTGFILWLLAVVAIPGYMSHYCKRYDPQEIFNPLRALSRVHQGGLAYWKAWSIVLICLLLSFSGLLVLGIGFLFSSVWFWQTAAFSFATVFTQRFELDKKEAEKAYLEKPFKMVRNSGQSIRQELSKYQIQLDKNKRIPARQPDSKARVVHLTKHFQHEQTALLFVDEYGPFVHAVFFSDLNIYNPYDLHQKEQLIIGKLKQPLHFKTLLRFLIEADIIETFVHESSEMTIQITSTNIAEIRGSHTYFTNEKNIDYFSFKFVCNEHNEMLLTPL